MHHRQKRGGGFRDVSRKIGATFGEAAVQHHAGTKLDDLARTEVSLPQSADGQIPTRMAWRWGELN